MPTALRLKNVAQYYQVHLRAFSCVRLVSVQPRDLSLRNLERNVGLVLQQHRIDGYQSLPKRSRQGAGRGQWLLTIAFLIGRGIVFVRLI